MKIACLFLTCNRPELSIRCIQQNFFNADKDADVFLIDNGSSYENLNTIAEVYPFTRRISFLENKGIAAAINKGISLTQDYDAIVTLANDILMPQGWLRAMAEAAQRIPDTGMVGVHCVEAMPPISELGVHEIFTPFGNVLITRKALDAAGYFSPNYGMYGMDDSDYAFRLQRMSFRNYYVPDLHSEHIGHDVGNGSEYRKMKDDSLNKAMDVWNSNTARYDETKNYYVAYGD